MLAMYWGKVPSDDVYNRIRSRYGDTTSAAAQLAALRSLGLRADFWTNGTRADIARQVLGGRPVGVGWLHRGPITSPRGGHWSVVVGLAGPHHFLMHDPYGEPYLVSGTHNPRRSGAYLTCSWANFLMRWEVEGPRTGWYLTAQG